MKTLKYVFLCLFSVLVWAKETPSWLEGFKIKGDFRVRGEFTDYDNDATKDRNRGRFRLRLGIEKKLNETVTFNLRLASGVGEATSTNQSFDGGFGEKDFWIDQAYLTYKKAGYELGAGKVKNPLETTDILWDGDVNPEGLYQGFEFGKGFLNLTEFMVEEQSSKKDSNLLAIQGGFKPSKALTVAVGYHYYTNLDTAGLALEGNTGFAEDFHIADFLLIWKGKAGEKSISATVHYLNNLDENAPEGISAEDTGYGFFFDYGSAKNPGEWSLGYKYAHIEANSVVGAFADSDFGFADKEGHVLKFAYASHKWMTWKASLFLVDGILKETTDFTRLQLDCEVKF
ncbi:MAG: putative porin [Acidobacteria bacterium]|nr:putative porin [Acidobacteriota bacterium]MCB9399100.1 putative porin [Acidobacteriota bacterium]